MNFTEIFSEYYTLYRGEAIVPAITDDEYTIAIRLANDGIRRWANYDTLWKELFTDTLLTNTDAVLTTTDGTATYACPTEMAKVAGIVQILNAENRVVKRLHVVDPEEIQFLSDDAEVVYFLGDPNNGFNLVFNKAPDVTGQTIRYAFYKKPTTISDGDSLVDMVDPSFLVNHMLATRYRVSRNPYYGTAKRDAENLLAQMKMKNDSGTWDNPWKVADRSGSIFGQDINNTWSF